ncbi:hypothetical protein [Spiroplasma endosymbiont of Tricholauxania praeusta]|uniref:hypothetical protein n=1 Tax=Spiroplasma endosymbiont of Tricholauxania praeusta TaxID=3066296 RepID=UPI0030D1608F
MKKENFNFLEEKTQKINTTDILYPKTEIDEIQKPNNKVIILNGKYGSGKTSIIESIPNEHTKIINISLLEDNLR